MKIVNHSISNNDNTEKYTYLTSDNNYTEACVLFFDDREAPIVICISSQVGCRYSCSFCITGNKKYIRNLVHDEIVKQVELIFERQPSLLNNKFEITYMGAGEPLDNYSTVFSTINYFSSYYPNLHKINISTTLPVLDIDFLPLKAIRAKVHFQYSLHFTQDNIRRKIFRNPNLPTIQKSLSYLSKVASQLNDKPSYNYILFKDVNDSIEDAERLSTLAKQFVNYIKISRYSAIPYSDLAPTTEEAHHAFIQKLNDENIDYKLFHSKGEDVHAACGHFLYDIDI